MTPSSTTIGMATLVVLTVAVCGCSDAPRIDEPDADGALPEGPSPIDAGAAGDAGTLDGGAPIPLPPTAEAEAAAVLAAIDATEIVLARLALERAVTPGARAYAREAIDDHRAAEASLATLVRSQGIVPFDPPVAHALRATARAVEFELWMHGGVEFDVVYLESQVVLHGDALVVIDEQLLPAVHDPRFREHLTTVRARVAAHLDHARRSRDEIASM
ncbi:DUF4142 domain-containing protein [Sandaracinus amylolyticus]|uniref:DUF4142 domain-containing protein n=1 Tax=Sandaracinus amylolyticus TaxID=927083 RepID=A0A0F6YEV6_9BACT|nr:DUF4142 domain-containing protein [Sandaracinus amylolyticus]AKF02866.1 hypothetical protein DB32_000014 [Sandaracinus amylolyticus]